MAQPPSARNVTITRLFAAQPCACFDLSRARLQSLSAGPIATVERCRGIAVRWLEPVVPHAPARRRVSRGSCSSTRITARTGSPGTRSSCTHPRIPLPVLGRRAIGRTRCSAPDTCPSLLRVARQRRASCNDRQQSGESRRSRRFSTRTTSRRPRPVATAGMTPNFVCVNAVRLNFRFST